MSNPSTNAPVKKIVRIEAKSGRSAAMRTALVELEQATQQEAGCRQFVFFQAIRDESVFLLVEDFVDTNALMQHMQLPHTQAFFALDLAASIKALE